VATDVCASCGTALAERAGRKDRDSVHCSAACRQKAYRERQGAAAGVQELIDDIGRRAVGAAAAG
jgi:RNA polymerase sigma-70 factor (ECF subfamily)